MNKSISVWITTSFIGFHAWKKAPPEVLYLSYSHRHKFGVRVEVEEFTPHQVEFHLLKQEVDLILSTFDLKDLPSCEEIASTLGEGLLSLRKSVTIYVDEDGECGVTVILTKE